MADRFWQAMQEDGVDYLSPVEERWGELCRSSFLLRSVLRGRPLLGLLRTVWSDPRPGNYFNGATVGLSIWVAAGRRGELLEVLELQRFPFCHDRRFRMQALLSEGRHE